MNIKFTNKQEYLEYRAAWKAQYDKLSDEIHRNKRTYYHNGLRVKATAMLEERIQSKVEANRQYLEAKRLRVIEEGKIKMNELLTTL